MKKLLLLLLVFTGMVSTASAWNDMYLICKENDNWNVASYGSNFKFVKVDDTHYRATVPGSYITDGNWNFRFREYNGDWYNIGPIGSSESDNTEVNGTPVSTNYKNSNNASFYVKKNTSAEFVQIFIEWADPYWKVTANVITEKYTIAYANPDNWATVKAYAYYSVDNCALQYPLGAWGDRTTMTSTNNYYTVEVPAISGGKVIFTDDGSNKYPSEDGFEIVENGVYGESGQVENVNVSAGSLGKATFSSIYPLDFTGITTVKAYRVTSASAGVLSLEQITGSVPARIGLYIEGDENANYDVPTTPTTSATSSMLVAGTGSKVYPTEVISETTYTNYILTNKTTDNTSAPLRFYKANDGGNTVPAGKAYLQIPNGIAGAHEFFWFEDDMTGIEKVSVDTKALNGAVYNLAGQRVAQPTKGLYIVNGKKVVLK